MLRKIVALVPMASPMPPGALSPWLVDAFFTSFTLNGLRVNPSPLISINAFSFYPPRVMPLTTPPGTPPGTTRSQPHGQRPPLGIAGNRWELLGIVRCSRARVTRVVFCGGRAADEKAQTAGFEPAHAEHTRLAGEPRNHLGTSASPTVQVYKCWNAGNGHRLPWCSG